MQTYQVKQLTAEEVLSHVTAAFDVRNPSIEGDLDSSHVTWKVIVRGERFLVFWSTPKNQIVHVSAGRLKSFERQEDS